MKKTDWTDRMLAALVELYPVETTAYTAAVLNLSESTVKQKARELGLVKMAKSRWMERADYIRNHFQECSFSEIGKALGITRMSVGRIAAALGLKRSSEEKHLISSRIRTQMVKRERRRIVFGLEPITGTSHRNNRKIKEFIFLIISYLHISYFLHFCPILPIFCYSVHF